jgi:hypothetical protein
MLPNLPNAIAHPIQRLFCKGGKLNQGCDLARQIAALLADAFQQAPTLHQQISACRCHAQRLSTK